MSCPTQEIIIQHKKKGKIITKKDKLQIQSKGNRRKKFEFQQKIMRLLSTLFCRNGMYLNYIPEDPREYPKSQ